MNKKEVAKLRHGLYRFWWKEEGEERYSLAAVGSLTNGQRWYAVTNWTAYDPKGIACTNWKIVKSVELVEERKNA